MTKYTYQGPTDSSVTLKVKGKKDQEVLLFRGKEVELPEDHPYVKTLVALGYLVPPVANTPSPVETADNPENPAPETLKKGEK